MSLLLAEREGQSKASLYLALKSNLITSAKLFLVVCALELERKPSIKANMSETEAKKDVATEEKTAEELKGTKRAADVSSNTYFNTLILRRVRFIKMPVDMWYFDSFHDFEGVRR